ncbi:NAD(P)-binding protein [Pyrenochaeta sp. DS3sAY3a]|nr:NAD(P)-binding protein [Pyrenochaeta sp. DS3sAY3a]
MTFHPDSLPSLSGRTYIVTGATSGIGYQTAARLAQHEAHVYVCARTAEKGASTISSIRSTYPNAKLSVLVMNHLKLSSVVEAAKSFLAQEADLHGLVNNAGIMATPFAMTDDGYEEQWQTNYLAHWVFTTHLLPLLRETAKRVKEAGLPAGTVRIVNLSSSGHYGAPKGGIVFEDTRLKDGKGMDRYGQSKLANILHAKTLHGLYGPSSSSSAAGNGEIWTTIVQPGLVKSSLGNNSELPWTMKLVLGPFRWIGAEFDADRGSWTSLYCVASPDMKRDEAGRYFQRIADPNGWQSSLAKDLKLAKRLEKWTQDEMTKGGWTGELGTK